MLLKSELFIQRTFTEKESQMSFGGFSINVHIFVKTIITHIYDECLYMLYPK